LSKSVSAHETVSVQRKQQTLNILKLLTQHQRFIWETSALRL